MAKRLEEITATVTRERHRFGQSEPFTVVLDATTVNGDGREHAVALKGQTDDGGPQQHLTYRFYGSWSTYHNQRTGQSERQFKFQTFVQASPHGRAGVVKYLSNAPNIGRVLAGRLWDKFRGQAVKILREEPDIAAAACERLSAEGAAEASEWLKREQALEDCSIEIVDLLEGHGFPKATVKAAIKEWGNRAAQVIKASPYMLMRLRGCGFKRCDALYLELGHAPQRLKRQALCAWHHLASNTEGHTWFFEGVVQAGLAGAIAGADVRASAAMELACRAGILAMTRTDGPHGEPDWDGDTLWLAEGKKARNETRLAAYVVEAMAESSCWPGVGSCEQLSDHQRENLAAATTGPLGILGGSPGTGKTFAAAQLIKLLGDLYGFDQIAAAAPTGKAAVRLTEALSAYGIPLAARTIHSLLAVEQADDRGGWSFAHNRNNPLPYKVLVIDEASMIDADLACSLFAARARGAMVLIIGDVNQLPPVGHGAPLRDMIAAGVPYGELREIRRNSGAIVEACADIRDGKAFRCGENLQLVDAAGPRQQIDAMVDTVKSAAQQLGVHPVWGVQVLCAVNKKSDLSRRELNRVLQAQLNPAPATPGTPFRRGDKVVNTKNGHFPLAEIPAKTDELQLSSDGKTYVANGELGEVMLVEPNYMHVRLTAPDRLIVVPRGAADVDDDQANDGESTGTGCNWDLGYALSVHKSQGSEWPAVVVMVDDSGAAKRVCSREWLYTAISRAKQCCYLVGKLGVASGFTRRTAIDKRKTFLAYQIKEGTKPA